MTLVACLSLRHPNSYFEIVTCKLVLMEFNLMLIHDSFVIICSNCTNFGNGNFVLHA